MSSGGGHFKGSLSALLALHFSKVEGIVALCLVELLPRIDLNGLQERLTVEMVYEFAECTHTDHFQLIDHASLPLVLAGNKERVVPQAASFDGNRQRTAHSSHGAVEAQLAHEHHTLERGTLNEVAHCEHGDGQREVET